MIIDINHFDINRLIASVMKTQYEHVGVADFNQAFELVNDIRKVLAVDSPAVDLDIVCDAIEDMLLDIDKGLGKHFIRRRMCGKIHKAMQDV